MAWSDFGLSRNEEAKYGLITEQSRQQKRRCDEPWVSTRTALIITSATNLLQAAVLVWFAYIYRRTCYFEADFVSPQKLPYGLKTIQFDDLLKYNTTSREVYREMDMSLPQYFGTPSPAIDANWANLLQYEYPAVSGEEMGSNPHLNWEEGDQHPVTGQYHAALDVFHNLHCLNAVRMELDKDYYGTHHHGQIEARAETGHGHEAPGAVEAAQRDHIDHCMNHIRQSLQCRPDLSPAAMHVFEDMDGSKFFLGNAERHTCYDWSSIINWAAARKGGLGYTTPVK